MSRVLRVSLAPRLDLYLRQHPLVPIGGWLLKRRFWLLTCLGALLLAGDAADNILMADASIFGEAGRHLLSSDWRSTFADPRVQVGPVHVIVNGAFHLLAEFIGVRFQHLIGGLTYLTLVAMGIFTYRQMLGFVRWRVSPGIEFYLGAMVLAGGPATLAVVAGHLGEALIPYLWVLAAVKAKSDKSLAAGLLIGLAGGFKLWGALGLPLLLLSPTFRRTLSGVLIASAITAIVYAPFVLFGNLRTFEFEWYVSNSSLIGLVVPPGSPFGWQLRVVQGAGVVALGSILAYLARTRSVHAMWALPLSLVALRLLLDPLTIEYYAVPLSVLGLLGACFLASTQLPGLRVPIAALFYLLLYPAFLDFGPNFVVSVLAGSVLTLWYPFVDDRSQPSEAEPLMYPALVETEREVT